MIRVLGIETSCDETAAAVVGDGTEVLSNIVYSQIDEHRPYGGVIPELASRSHMDRVTPTIERALDAAGVGPADLDAVAVTARPGLVGCLLVGMAAAKALAWRFGLPLVGVDHIAAHVHAAWMARPQVELPMLALVASGGHTAMYRLDEPTESTLLGRTIDDAAGEAFDKAAAMLGLAYPGGPSIERAADGGDPRAVRLPRSMLGRDSLDFSFSGVKTALLYTLRGPGLQRPAPTSIEPSRLADLAASFQAAIVDTLTAKLRRCAERFPYRSLAIGGGVARNTALRRALADDPVLSTLEIVMPPLEFCSDNAAMVAGLGTALYHRGVRHDLSLEAAPTSRRRK